MKLKIKPYTIKDIQVGTVLVYRNYTESFKYFRILEIFETFNEHDYFNNYLIHPLFPKKYFTKFEMSKNLEDDWVKAEHTCELECWHLGCDILFQPPQLYLCGKYLKLNSIE